MEYILTTRSRTSDGLERVQRESFAEFGAAIAHALQVYETAQGGDTAVPVSIADTGERQLLGEQEIARLAQLAAKDSPVGDQVAQAVFASLDDDTLDRLCRWMLFRMRASGVGHLARLAVLGAILDAVSPDE